MLDSRKRSRSVASSFRNVSRRQLRQNTLHPTRLFNDEKSKAEALLLEAPRKSGSEISRPQLQSSIEKEDLRSFLANFETWKKQGGTMRLSSLFTQAALRALAILLRSDEETLTSLSDDQLHKLLFDYAVASPNIALWSRDVDSLCLRGYPTAGEAALFCSEFSDLMDGKPGEALSEEAKLKLFEKSIKTYSIRQEVFLEPSESLKEAFSSLIQSIERHNNAKAIVKLHSAPTDSSFRLKKRFERPRWQPPSSDANDHAPRAWKHEPAKTPYQRSDMSTSRTREVTCYGCGLPGHTRNRCPTSKNSFSTPARATPKLPSAKAVGDDHSKGLVVEVIVNAGGASCLTLKALVDSGATHTFISPRVSEELMSMGVSKDGYNGKATLANSSLASTHGRMRLKLALSDPTKGDETIETIAECIVMDIGSNDMLLGWDVLCKGSVWNAVNVHMVNLLAAKDAPISCNVVNGTDHSTNDIVWSSAEFDDEAFSDPSTNAIDPFPPITAMNSDEQVTICGEGAFKDSLTELVGKFAGVFGSKIGEPARVPPMRIELVEGATPFKSKVRGMSDQIRIECKAQIDALIDKGILHKSKSNFGSPVVMVKQKAKYRMCIDYKRLNTLTKKFSGPLPIMNDLIEVLSGNKFFAKMDLTSGYHQILMDEESRKYTAVITPWGLFEFSRIPFGLCNAPGYFQQVMNTILAPYIDVACVVYIDDIIVFGKTEAQFQANLESVLEALRDHNLRVKPEKTVIGTDTIDFLGFKISGTSVSLDEDRRHQAINWKKPESPKELRSFLGFIQFFSRFIQNSAIMLKPLHQLAAKWKERNGVWSDSEEEAFRAAKEAVLSCPSIRFVDYTRPIFLRTDASIVGIGAYLHQRVDPEQDSSATNDVPIGFFSKAFNDTQRRWSTLEQEAYAVYAGIIQFSSILRGHEFILETDHKNITFIRKEDSPKVVRWFLRLQEYSFTVRHVPGTLNTVADSLSRCYNISGVDEDMNTPLSEEVKHAIQRVHNGVCGHRGVSATMNILKKADSLIHVSRADVARYIKTCGICQKVRARMMEVSTAGRHTSSFEPFQVYNMDYIGPLPTDQQGNCFIFCIIDTFTRYIELFPCKSASSEEAVSAMLQVFGRYGPPTAILSDRGTHFTSQLTKQFLSALGADQHLSIAYRPQTNGMIERSHGETMKHFRCLMLEDMDRTLNWSVQTPIVQRIMNSSIHSSVGTSPSMLVYGNRVDVDRGLFASNTKEGEIVSTHQWVQQTQDFQDRKIAQSQKHLQEVVRERLAKQPKEYTKFQVDDMVLWNKAGRAGNKLSPPLKGPYRVADQSGSRVTIQSLVDDTTTVVHVSSITPFVAFDEQDAEEAIRLAATDKEEYVVKEVLQYTGTTSKNARFLIRWDGYTSEDDSWVSYKAIQDNEALQVFIDKNPHDKVLKRITKL